jgi:hypothetical protein
MKVAYKNPINIKATPVRIEIQTPKVLSDDKKKEILAWCDAMRKKYPLMKAQRIANKAVAYFKL